MFKRIETRCSACDAVSHGSPEGSVHRKCPKGTWEVKPGKFPRGHKLFYGLRKGRGTWRKPPPPEDELGD